MSQADLLSRLPSVQGTYKPHEPLSRHTWFAVGGPAEVMFIPQDEDDLSHFLQQCPSDIPLFTIGGGSNLLVRDGGLDGVTIKLDSPAFKSYHLQDNILTCGCGLRNIELQKIMLKHSIGGLEFLSGIPGCIGGSVKTNAGCFGHEVKEFITSATIFDRQGHRQTISVDDLHLSYRHSRFPADWIITSISFRVQPDSPQHILEIITDQKNRRLKYQPHNARTAGSTFKNPEGHKAWELIKQSGCDHLSCGGAQVSDIHCNFLINNGSATAADIESLGEQIIKQVQAHTSVTLEWEVNRIGKKL